MLETPDLTLPFVFIFHSTTKDKELSVDGVIEMFIDTLNFRLANWNKPMEPISLEHAIKLMRTATKVHIDNFSKFLNLVIFNVTKFYRIF